MASMTVRNLPDEVHRALRARAAKNGRSTEAEVRSILESAVTSDQQVRLGSLLVEVGREANLTDKDLVVFERDKTPARGLDLE